MIANQLLDSCNNNLDARIENERASGWVALQVLVDGKAPAKKLVHDDQTLQLVQRLLVCRADLMATNSSGTTALHLATASGFEEAVRLLVNKRAEVNAKNGRKQHPLDLARSNKNIADFLRHCNKQQKQQQQQQQHVAAEQKQQHVAGAACCRSEGGYASPDWYGTTGRDCEKNRRPRTNPNVSESRLRCSQAWQGKGDRLWTPQQQWT